MSSPEEFKKQYESSSTWQQRVIILSLFHSTQCIKNKNWNMKQTAAHFCISIGLVSENIRLAKEIQGPKCEELMKAKSREDGLKLIDRRKYKEDRVIKPIFKS